MNNEHWTLDKEIPFKAYCYCLNGFSLIKLVFYTKCNTSGVPAKLNTSPPLAAEA